MVHRSRGLFLQHKLMSMVTSGLEIEILDFQFSLITCFFIMLGAISTGNGHCSANNSKTNIPKLKISAAVDHCSDDSNISGAK